MIVYYPRLQRKLMALTQRQELQALHQTNQRSNGGLEGCRGKRGQFERGLGSIAEL
jgi:hypothetical protein